MALDGRRQNKSIETKKKKGNNMSIRIYEVPVRVIITKNGTCSVQSESSEEALDLVQQTINNNTVLKCVVLEQSHESISKKVVIVNDPVDTGPKINSVHYTIIGFAMQPPEADVNGFLDYREGFEDLPSLELSRPERAIREQVEQIARWRNGG